MDIVAFCLPEDRCLREGMDRLNQMQGNPLFLLDASGRLTAALTDGDVRRYLLSGGTLEDSVARAGNHPPITARSREEALRLLAERGCVAVPVLDGAGCVLDIVLADTRSSETYPALGLPVVIMAGGKGTRLEPYTKILPKPLIPVGDLPIMEHMAARSFTASSIIKSSSSRHISAKTKSGTIRFGTMRTSPWEPAAGCRC